MVLWLGVKEYCFFFFSCGESVLSLGIKASSPTELRALELFYSKSPSVGHGVAVTVSRLSHALVPVFMPSSY